jgi:hypothetical protein
MVLTALIFSVGAVMGADYTVTVLPPTPDTPPKTRKHRSLTRAAR